jgi:hypothetical protein
MGQEKRKIQSAIRGSEKYFFFSHRRKGKNAVYRTRKTAAFALDPPCFLLVFFGKSGRTQEETRRKQGENTVKPASRAGLSGKKCNAR